MLSLKARLEGLLYIVGEDGLTIEAIETALDLTEIEAQTALKELEEDYQSEDRGIQLTAYGEIYRLVSKKEINDAALKVFQMNKNSTLSQSALETLAIIAYRQPITRIEIEEIRGVSCETMLRKLLSRNLIREAGRSEAIGRPILYEVTKDFMDVFKLVSLNELPELPTYNDTGDDNLFDL